MLVDGALWRASVPKNWNGTLLLYARGYSSKLSPPKLAPGDSEKMLLEAGYALAASQYPQAGWSVEQAIPSQVMVLDAFSNVYTKPDRIIAWGSSMGGLITAALAERHSDRLDGAITLCASAFGAVPMMNMAFDGAFTLATLIAPEEAFSPVGKGDNFAAVRKLMDKVKIARETPLGRARVALAGVLGGIPSWTQKDTLRPVATDYNLQEANIAKAIGMGVFLPRGDQERRAQGVFSGNSDIDYRKLLAASGRSDFVEAMYQMAGASLDDDLVTLARQDRIKPDTHAVGYMRENFTPSGHVTIPVLNAHTIGDGMTSPALQAGYTELIMQRSGRHMVAAAWLERAGHCTETEAEHKELLTALEERLDSGQWPDLSAYFQSKHDDLSKLSFTDYEPYPVPRACIQSDLCGQSLR
ncbi:prolyl oligopeptidase family serine peptidase [Alteromonas oceani]|uniref:Prolyl oligopeptidase family serine peptidase n=1 Tax=Alteromonas oceani TaxID=2071609 RepID=A0ABV7JYG5_9ALTE|nr:prolyl oligopeptidase family serine peptidase [Alteromonas oceani]